MMMSSKKKNHTKGDNHNDHHHNHDNKKKKKWTILGQDPDILMAMWSNILSWFVATFMPSYYMSYLLPHNEYELHHVDDENDEIRRTTTTTTKTRNVGTVTTQCISIGRPGGFEQLRLIKLKANIVTKGYNCGTDGTPFISIDDLVQQQQQKSQPHPSQSQYASSTPSNTTIVILQNKAFSVNYADCCIRWGLYESAKQFVGWPIVPGFDVAGIVQQVIPPIHSTTTTTTTNTADNTNENDNDNTDTNGKSKDDKNNTTTTTPQFQPGDVVFGCTLFGAYSTQIAIPANQLRHVPSNLTLTQAASLPAVSLTALYALYLSGHYVISNHTTTTISPPTTTSTSSSPSSSPTTTSSNNNSSFHTNRGILIHSAAGGVGSMAIQMAKLLNLHPIVGIVGRTHKVEAAKALGCHYVISKEEFNNKNNNKNTTTTTTTTTATATSSDWWEVVREISPSGYSTILDPNGAATLAQSYQHLCPTGRLVVYGFHSNVPMNQGSLHPWSWIQMGCTMQRMPCFDPMDMVVSNKSILGFNLSFFAQETTLVSLLFQQICLWMERNEIQCPRIIELEMNRIQEAHELIQSGQSIGKIVMTQPSHEQ